MLARPDLLNTFAVAFDQDVNVSSGDLIIRNDTLGTIVATSSVGFSYDAATLTATWDFSSLVLDPAFYTFELSDSITGVVSGLALDGDSDGTAGGSYLEEVYVAIVGDANLDGSVDVLVDAFVVVANLNTTTDLGFLAGDFTGDGQVTVVDDAFILVANLGRDVRPPATALLGSSIVQSKVSLPVQEVKYLAMPVDWCRTDVDELEEFDGDAFNLANVPSSRN